MSHNIDLVAAAVHFSAFYLAIIMISGVFFAFGNMSAKKKRKYIFVVSIALFVLMAFRAEGMGNDTDSYIAMFNKIAAFTNPLDYVRNSSLEAGFTLYCWILSRILNDARILFAVTAAFVVFSIGRFVYKYVAAPGIFYCLFIGAMHFDFFLSGIRNAISIAIFLFAIEFLLNRKAAAYFAICAVAILFHNTAVVYFLIYPLFSAKALGKRASIYSSTLLVFLAFISGFFFDSLIEIFFRIFPKYMYYVGGAMLDGKTRLAVVLKIAVCLLLIVVPKTIKKRPIEDERREAMGKRMAMLNLLVMFVAAGATAFMRLATLFQTFTLMQYSNEVERIHTRSSDKLWLITFTLLAFYLYGLVLVVLKTPEWQTTYPIQLSWWIN